MKIERLESWGLIENIFLIQGEGVDFLISKSVKGEINVYKTF